MTRNRFLLLMAFTSTCGLGGQALRGLEQYQVTAYLLVLATLLILFLVFRASDRRRQRQDPR